MKITSIKTINGMETFRRFTLPELLDELQGKRHSLAITNYRQDYLLLQRETPAIRQECTKEMLKSVPVLCFSTEMKKKDDKTIVLEHNNLIFLSVSNLRNDDIAEALREKASALPYTKMAFIGVSGTEIIIVCELRPIGKEVISNEDRKTFIRRGYAALRKIYGDHLRVVMDVIDPLITTTCRMSYDREAVYNPLSSVFHVDMLSAVPSQFDGNGTLLPMQVENREDMHNWRRIFIANLHKAQTVMFNKDTEDYDFEKLLLLAHYCHETNMPQALAIRYTLICGDMLSDEILIRDTFMAEYEKDIRNAYPTKNISATAQTVLRTSYFLNTHFRFRKNVLNGIVEYRVNDGSDFDYHLLSTEAQNTMTIMAMESGLNSWDKDLNRYIHSNRIPDYDPINIFIESLPKWDGRDRVTAMAQRVPTDTKNWEYYFHIWMLSMVAQWMGRDEQHGNAIAPILIGAQATGKSSFCRIILPECLMTYYNDNIHFKDDKSVFLALSSFALLNIDEFDTLSRSQQPLLKYLLSKTDVKYRAAYKGYIEQHKRYASFIATTNKQRPLSDPTGSRRFICVSVNGPIDFTSPVDHLQLYAQLRTEVLRGDRFWFTKEEADAITKQNEPFQKTCDLRTMLLTLFKLPEKNDILVFLSNDDIKDLFIKSFPDYINESNLVMKLGHALKSLGFQSHRSNTQRGYQVVIR